MLSLTDITILNRHEIAASASAPPRNDNEGRLGCYRDSPKMTDEKCLLLKKLFKKLKIKIFFQKTIVTNFFLLYNLISEIFLSTKF